MTAAARRMPRHAEPVAHRGDEEFVPLRQAAERLGRNEASLRRDCGKLAATGMARQIRSASGQANWHVHRSLDPRLVPRADEAVDESATEILLHATRGQRDRAAAKARVLIAYRDLVASGKPIAAHIDSFIAEHYRGTGLDRLSYRQLREWARHAPPTDQPKRLLAFFIDRRGGDQRSSEATGRGCHPEAWAEFERVYLTPQRWSIAKAWRHVQALAKANGWQWPGQRHVIRLVSEKIDPGKRCMAREGHDAWRSRFGYKLQQHPEAWGAGEMWIGDHARLDFFARRSVNGVWTEIRLWLTAWLDWRTRKLVGWWIDVDPSADTIRYAMHAAIKAEGGPPRRITIDNGKDYASYANVGVTKQQRRELIRCGEDWALKCQGLGLFGMLGIETHFAAPYNHDGKARIERFFGTAHGEFCKTFDTYCGAKPGDVPKHGVAMDRLPTLDDVRGRFPRFAQWYNDRCEHGIDDLADDQGRRLSPSEAMNQWRTTRSIMPRPEALALLMHRWEQPKSVGKLGIGVRIAGRTVYYGQDCVELRPLQGRKASVHVTCEPQDMSRVFVYDEQFRFLCVAQANGLHGGASPMSRAALASAMKRKRDHERAVRDTLRDGHMSIMTAADIARDEQDKIDADRRAERSSQGIGVENTDQQLRIVRTPVDDQLEAVQRAEFRKAAGAESMRSAPGFTLDDLLDVEPERSPECGVDFDAIPLPQGDDDEPDSIDFDNVPDADAGETSRTDAPDFWERL